MKANDKVQGVLLFPMVLETDTPTGDATYGCVRRVFPRGQRVTVTRDWSCPSMTTDMEHREAAQIAGQRK